jgi:hypothetical protein
VFPGSLGFRVAFPGSLGLGTVRFRVGVHWCSYGPRDLPANHGMEPFRPFSAF